MAASLTTPVGILTTLLLATLVHGLTISYCSSENTAGDFQALYAQYQSNGLCENSCTAYAYAVLQGNNCWCSDYAPSDQVNTYNCDQQCPGYPNDWCGNPSAGLYGYFQLSVAPSGTASGATTASASSASVSPISSSPGSSSSSPAISSSSPSTSSAVVVASSVSSTASSINSVNVASSTSSRASSATTSALTSTTDQPSQVYTSVMTVTGQVRTVVITPTSSADAGSLGQGATHSGGVSTGKVVGIVLGVALGLGLLIGLAVWFWLRRKHNAQSRASSQNGAYVAEDGDTSRTTPSRQVSQMSSSGLLGKGPRIMTAGYGPNNGNGNGNGSNPRSPDTVSPTGIDRRSLGTDQRLNPYAIFAHEEARMSSVSLQDNQDYSRQLRIANPD